MINNQFSRAVVGPQQPILGNHQNVFIADTPQLSEAIYFPQHPQLNLSTLNQLQTSPHYQNSHSLTTSINGIHQSSTNTYDSRLAHAYASASSAPSLRGNNGTLMENALKATASNQPSALFLDNFAPQLQTDQAQQVYRDPNTLSQTFPQTLQLQHSSIARHTQRAAELMQHQHNYVSNDVAATMSPSQVMHLHHLPSSNQPIFLSADGFGSTSSSKMSGYLPFKMTTSFPTAINEMYTHQLQTSTSTANVVNSASPVVLDRINICINNHYTDPTFSSPTVDTGTTCANAAADTPALSSPIIPTIQHNAVIDPSLLIEPASNSNDTSILLPVPSTMNEPDSTTAPHTPPATPDNTNNLIVSVNAIQSPSTSSTAKIDESFKDFSSSIAKANYNATTYEQVELPIMPTERTDESSAATKEVTLEHHAQNSSPIPVVDLVTESTFSVGDDVFVKIDDDRLYLGTVIDSKYQRFRVRFDDASEMWCSPKQMRKFGVSVHNTSTGSAGEKEADDSDSGALCVACKKRDAIDVEICERCGRGYHKACTTETSPGSDEWICKRCSKSMKLDSLEINCEEYENCLAITEQRQQLPYDMQSLHWDSKHRVNDEQIYCYCSKTGQFDYNMLQCCKCLNWYHTGCVQNFKDPLLRGDGFFVFCCAICSVDGNEFLRRLHMDCVDFMHLVLYNLSTKKKHQNHKYHHLTKDIYPFVLARRQTSLLPEEWSELDDDDLKQSILSTLKNNVERFVCGRELKRDYYFYGLRHNGPPMSPTEMPEIRRKISQVAEIDDHFILKDLKLTLCKFAKENSELTASVSQPVPSVTNFNSEKEDTDGKFTSDDEIPIKLILEKEKIKNTENQENSKENREENRHETLTEENLQIKSMKSPTKLETTKSHKRKAFTLSRFYKESTSTIDKQLRLKTANSESSSDENSSSSRGTSLDQIIPPPKNFLGANNPFRTVSTPTNSTSSERKVISFGRNILGGPTIRNSVVNAPALDFCSNLAALKHAGVLPNLNTTTFARAAGQPRMVRTIKRRLSAKDIMIGPNQEIRRRRTRRLSSNVEVISTTTINPISSFFPINNASNSTKTAVAPLPIILRKHNFPSSSAAGSQIPAAKTETQAAIAANKPTVMHGRRLRVRPQNTLPTNSRRSSLSGASTSSTTSSLSSISGNATPQTAGDKQYSESAVLSDLHQTVNKYFGVSHLIATGEQFSIHAKRQLPNGQTQLLVEWGVKDENSSNADSTTGTETETGEKKISQDS